MRIFVVAKRDAAGAIVRSGAGGVVPLDDSDRTATAVQPTGGDDLVSVASASITTTAYGAASLVAATRAPASSLASRVGVFGRGGSVSAGSRPREAVRMTAASSTTAASVPGAAASPRKLMCTVGRRAQISRVCDRVVSRAGGILLRPRGGGRALRAAPLVARVVSGRGATFRGGRWAGGHFQTERRLPLSVPLPDTSGMAAHLSSCPPQLHRVLDLASCVASQQAISSATTAASGLSAAVSPPPVSGTLAADPELAPSSSGISDSSFALEPFHSNKRRPGGLVSSLAASGKSRSGRETTSGSRPVAGAAVVADSGGPTFGAVSKRVPPPLSTTAPLTSKIAVPTTSALAQRSLVFGGIFNQRTQAYPGVMTATSFVLPTDRQGPASSGSAFLPESTPLPAIGAFEDVAGCSVVQSSSGSSILQSGGPPVMVGEPGHIGETQPVTLRAENAHFTLGSVRPPAQDSATRRALKQPLHGSSATTEKRSIKHARIRPVATRCGSAISQNIYAQLITARLDLNMIPTGEKLLRERVSRLRKQGVTVGSYFNVVSGEEEIRLIDAFGRMVVQHEEVETILTYVWREGYKMDTNHSLRKKITARFCGIGPKKVEQFLAQMVSTSVRNFPVPYTQQPRHVLASRPMEHIQIDCTHLYSVTHLGRVVTGLISFIDLFSRYIFALPITAECSWEVCRAFLMYCCIFGIPEIVQTDNGSAFLGEMKLMAQQLYGCQVVHGRPRYPESQGGVERSHGKLKNNIIGLSFEHFGDILRWPEMVPMGVRLANLAPHAAFNEELSPFTAFFGRIDNQPLAADERLLNGMFLQKAARIQTLEEKKQVRLAGRVNIEQYVAGNQTYDVELCFTPHAMEKATETERIYTQAGEEAQMHVDRFQSSSLSSNTQLKPRVAYTADGFQFFRESGTVVREILEFHRQCAEALLRRRLPAGQAVQDLTEVLRDVTVGDSSVKDCLTLFAQFSTSIRESASQFIVAYIESVDAGTRKRMPAPYNQNDSVWVLSLSENTFLCRKYKSLWISQTNRRLKHRLPGVVRSVDSASVNRPYEVEVFIDGAAAAAEDRCVCETLWLSGAALSPQTTLLRKLRQYGMLQQVPGLCIQKTSPTLFCLRRAASTCQRSLCEIHCAESPEGTCGAHRNMAKEIYTVTT